LIKGSLIDILNLKNPSKFNYSGAVALRAENNLNPLVFEYPALV